MLGRTHFVLGIASALIITQPQTVSGVITAMTGGAIGGWIVDIDIKNRDIEKTEEAKRESVYDAIIDALFVLAFIVTDFLLGKGMCQYIIDHWGIRLWGALFGLLILVVFGLKSKHRTFTHSFIAMTLFSGAVYLFCRPATLPFGIGYASHLLSDFFNMHGLQLLYPFKWKPCIKLCPSNKKGNRVLFWICLAVDIVLGAYLFSKAMTGGNTDSPFLKSVTEDRFLGLNALQLYLILINILTFLGFERNHRAFLRDLFDAYEKGELYKSENYETAKSRFEIWFLDILVFLGGGIGMLISLVIHLEIPAAYNGNWWAFCYTSVMFWFTVYCRICNPFGFELSKITWLSADHMPLFAYLICINCVSALFLYIIRKKRFKEIDIKHTVILLLGALGGTIGAIPMVFFINRQGKYFYVVTGFFVMLISQIVFVYYMMSAGVF